MIVTLQVLLYLAFYLAIFLLCVWALVDALRRPTVAYTHAGKLTKGAWSGILALATVLAFMALPAPIGLGFLSFLALGSAVAAIVYLVDVRPAVQPYSRRRGRGPRGPSSGGGW